MDSNIKQAVPFFMITNMENSLKFYVDGLGFEMPLKWTPRGRIEWCYLKRGGAAMMLQEMRTDVPDYKAPAGKLGEGVSICFMCQDAIAIYHELLSKDIQASRPFVGNNMWVTGVADPDGYRLEFESETTVPEGTEYTGT